MNPIIKKAKKIELDYKKILKEAKHLAETLSINELYANLGKAVINGQIKTQESQKRRAQSRNNKKSKTRDKKTSPKNKTTRKRTRI